MRLRWIRRPRGLCSSPRPHRRGRAAASRPLGRHARQRRRSPSPATARSRPCPTAPSFYFTVETAPTTASAALAKNSADAAAVIAAVKALASPPPTSRRARSRSTRRRTRTARRSSATPPRTRSPSTTTIAKAGAIVDAAVGAGRERRLRAEPLALRPGRALPRRAEGRRRRREARRRRRSPPPPGSRLGGVQTIVEGGGPRTPIPFARQGTPPRRRADRAGHADGSRRRSRSPTRAS